MGNCWNRPSTTDESLLREHDIDDDVLSMDASPETTMDDPARIYYLSPSLGRFAYQLTEEEQIKIAQRIGLIQNLPEGKYDDCEINTECVICMDDFIVGDDVRYLPCLHTYHTHCIDDWLMRKFTCPSCMDPIGFGL